MMKMKKTKTQYQVSVFTAIKDGTHFALTSSLFGSLQDAKKYAAMFDDRALVLIEERHLPL